ncbi:hypothetical protein ASE98_22475 [Pseudomonas sp. Leaf48]|uniref:SecDF P1 head subdomain-containing protein n=1 Tax=Pseudomonas sp. Leaf48 TaxID=1736221 RepID=UPI000725AFC1|nr:hypothetical protein [Pseudomonas sp. Leaf48]KQN51550.1 hypothetical protein ASE98_22475 [Pseudomonas sp. Leaf48]
MRGSAKALWVALGLMGALHCLAAEIAMSSASDFTEISVDLKGAHDPDFIILRVTLSPDAQHRMAQVTRENLHQPLKLFIDSMLVSTTTIQSAIEGPALMVVLPPETARNLLPRLLEPSPR